MMKKMNNIRDMAYKDNKLILTDIDNEKKVKLNLLLTPYMKQVLQKWIEKNQSQSTIFFRYILDLIEYGKYETNIDSEVVELFKKI